MINVNAVTSTLIEASRNTLWCFVFAYMAHHHTATKYAITFAQILQFIHENHWCQRSIWEIAFDLWPPKTRCKKNRQNTERILQLSIKPKLGWHFDNINLKQRDKTKRYCISMCFIFEFVWNLPTGAYNYMVNIDKFRTIWAAAGMRLTDITTYNHNP